MVILCIPFFILLLFYIFNINLLYKYLKSAHFSNYRELTPRFGFSEIPFIFSNDNLGDPKVAKLKKRCKYLFLFGIGYFTFLFLFFIVNSVGS